MMSTKCGLCDSVIEQGDKVHAMPDGYVACGTCYTNLPRCGGCLERFVPDDLSPSDECQTCINGHQRSGVASLEEAHL